MARVDVDQLDVLDSIIEFLRATLGLNERNCYLILSPEAAKIPTGGGYYVTVAPGGGSFDVDMQGGGGDKQLQDEASVIVTVYTRMRLDDASHDNKLISDRSRGLIALKGKMLRAMVNEDLVTKDGQTFLRDLVKALDYTPGQFDDKHQVGWLSTTFYTPFDWDLSTPVQG